MPPEFKDILLLAIMNPATLAAGFLVGRRADQVQKIVVAGFAAGIAGVLFSGLLMLTGLYPPKVRLLSGVFVASFVAGLVWAWIGFATRSSKGPDAG
jgi:hypothetical protein